MNKRTLAQFFNWGETVVLAGMLINAYVLGYQLELPVFWLLFPLALFVGNTWAFFKTKNTVLLFVQIVGLLLLLGSGVAYAMASLCLLPLVFVPSLYPKKWLKTIALFLMVMVTTLAIITVFTRFSAPQPQVVVEQSYEQGRGVLELRRQTVSADRGPNTLRGVYYELAFLGGTFTRLLYVCADDREITLSWVDGKTAQINGTPCSVFFSRLRSE